MSRGDDQFKVFFVAGDTSKPVIIVPTATALPECCFILPLFGNSNYVLSPDDLKQDETGFFRPYDLNAIDSVEFVIQKCENGVFVDKIIITNDDYGTYIALGDEIVNGLSLVSLKNINWSRVLLEELAGVYRVATNENSIFATEPIQHDYSFEFDLKEYTADRADKTVFFKVSNTGSMGDRKDSRKRMAFPANWVDGIRLPGSCGYDNDTYTKTYHRLRTGRLNHTETSRVKKTEFRGRPITEGARDFFANELMMADLVEFTDYNKNSANTHVATPVHGDGDFAPVYTRGSSKAHFIVVFTDAFDNMIKHHCTT